LPALSLGIVADLQLNAEKLLPEAPSAFGLIGRELDDGQRGAWHCPHDKRSIGHASAPREDERLGSLGHPSSTAARASAPCPRSRSPPGVNDGPDPTRSHNLDSEPRPGCSATGVPRWERPTCGREGQNPAWMAKSSS